MFTLTKEEEEFNARYKAAQDAAELAARSWKQVIQGYGVSAEIDKEELKRNYETTRDAVLSLWNAPIRVSIELKKSLNGEIEKRLPIGSYTALLDIAEETLAKLDTPEGERSKAVLRSMAVRVVDMIADPAFNAARANVVFQRYTALLATGLPAELVSQIMVAEASRPIPALNVGGKK